ncbi:MAG: hypothetical protein V1698_02945 [bacterium]
MQSDLIFNSLKIFSLAFFSFLMAMLWTPMLSHYLYKYKAWKKTSKKGDTIGDDAPPVFDEDHKKKEFSTPRMGGLLIWITVLAVVVIFRFLPIAFKKGWITKLNFLSRGQTWLPLVILISASIIGLIDDVLVIKGKRGINVWWRLTAVIAIGVLGALWFHYKLDWNTIYIPGLGGVFIGKLYIPLFVLAMIALFGGTPIDGLDGLAGGIFAASFASYAGIAFFLNQINIAAFCLVITGALLAFLWFNIPPARFYLGETGILGLVTTLTAVAFLTDSVVALPFIAFLPLLTAASDIIQILSKKFRKKRVFLAAPIHHHFQLKGWSKEKVVMRFWIISSVMAIIGMAVALVGRV